jgi:hypothetical protein
MESVSGAPRPATIIGKRHLTLLVFRSAQDTAMRKELMGNINEGIACDIPAIQLTVCWSAPGDLTSSAQKDDDMPRSSQVESVQDIGIVVQSFCT